MTAHSYDEAIPQLRCSPKTTKFPCINGLLSPAWQPLHAAWLQTHHVSWHDKRLMMLIPVLDAAEGRTAHIEGDFVVFLIGAVVHNYWDVRAWLPVFKGMGEMLKELNVSTQIPCSPSRV